MTNQERQALRKQMRELKKQGLEYQHLATSPEAYEIYKKVRFGR